MLDYTTAQFNEVLTKRAIALLEDREDFACINGAIPMIPTTVLNGTYKMWKASDFRRRHSEKHANGTEFKRVNTQLEDKTYSLEEYGYEEVIPDRGRLEGQAEDISMQMVEGGYATYDIALATKLVAGVFGADFTGHATTADATHFIQWSEATSNPVKNIDDYKAIIKAKIGTNPDSLLVNQDVFNALKNNATILALLKTTEDKILDASKLARFFGLKNVYVMASAETTTNQGQATQTIAQIASDVALLYYRGAGNGPVSPTTLKCYYNTATYGAGNNGVIIQDYREPKIASDVIQLVQDFDLVVPMPEGGLLLSDVIK